jgi:regulator of replication initiation timing
LRIEARFFKEILIIYSQQTTEIVQENTMLRAKLATLQGHLESAETEQKTNRETIYRMMNDQQNMSELGLQTDNLRVVTFRSREKNLHVRLTVNSICLIFCFDDLQYSVQ